MSKSPDRLFIGILGAVNSGKSTVWNVVFGASPPKPGVPRRGRRKTGRQWLRYSDYMASPAFLIYSSPEELNVHVSDILTADLEEEYKIVLCSVGNLAKGRRTVDHFKGRYDRHIFRLRPGYRSGNAADANQPTMTDADLRKLGCKVRTYDARHPQKIADAIRKLVYQWATAHTSVR